MEDRLFEIHNDNSFEPVFQNGSVVQALNRVKNCLNYSLKEEYGIEDSEITDKFLKLHGLDKDRFDFINNFESLIEQGIADNSIDTNANKGETSITGLLAETAMPINKLVGYRYLYRKMKDMYGKKRAKYLAGKMYDMSLALADSTNILKPYCWSVNASKLVLEGRPWGTLPSLPPKHLNSYTSCLAEILHQLSNHLAGAIAVGSFFLDLAHMMIYGDKKTLSDLKGTNYRKSVENALQSFIHSMNHLSRNSVESPFTNISIMDTIKLRSLIDDDNMGWYFENDEDLFGVPTEALKDCGEMEWKEYIIRCILELEEIYMGIMDKGDLCHDGRPITFPVSTLNISRQENADGTYDFADKEFLNNICKNHDIMRYNIYVSSGNKLASCCRLINDNDLFEMGSQVNSFGGAGLSLGSHRVVTINIRRVALESRTYAEFKELLKQRMEEASDILKAHKELIKDMVKKGTQPFISNGWINLDRMFSTFGIMGYYEASEDFKNRFDEDFDYISDMIEFMEENSRRISREKGIVTNIEEIPGESMSYKLANSDRWLFGEDKVKEPLYANQVIPLWKDTTLYEKFKAEGVASKMSGGGICHYSLGEKVTSKQAMKVIETALKCGCEHFALNPTYSICENDHYSFGKNKECPVCGGKITDNLTRTVGFFVKTSNMNTAKRTEDYEKRFYKGVGV